MPFACFARELLPPGGGERVVLGAAIVLGLPPLGDDEPLLLKLEQRGIERAVVERESVLAGLLDAARDAVTVEGPETLQRFEDHQGKGALLDFELLGHGPVLWDTHSTVMSRGGARNSRLRAAGCGLVRHATLRQILV